MIEEVKSKVSELLCKDDSGHGMDHINNVLRLSLQFCDEEPNVDKELVALIVLLHEVDDYKLFGEECAQNLTNAKKIMNEVGIDKEKQEKVLNSLSRFGYSKLLKGVRPQILEGQIASDADMCEALGVNGILRTYSYSNKHGRPFFDKKVFPVEDMDASKYNRTCSDSGVCHLFEKGLKLRKLMLTKGGKKEAQKRHDITVEFLYQLFDEDNVPEWKDYLDDFLKKN